MTVEETTGNNNNKRIWIGLGAAALFCLCAVVAAGFTFFKVGQRVQEGMKTDPESASQAARAIVDYELPAGYQEQMSMDLLVYTFVMMGPEPQTSRSGPLIMLARFNEMGANRDDMERQIQQSFEQQSGLRGLTMEIVDVRQVTIRGDEVDVTTFEGKDDNGSVMRQLVATFPAKNGTGMLMIMGPAQYWDKDVIDQFVESLH
ncbi:MAG: hypothetical protein ABIU06_11690 [Anaerolineales bacterium]